ncbi:mannose-6-phosphate isomerase, class I [Aerococcus urinaeequi]|uniref:Mannose-6-phosphate isomerase n=1 Tax=Aerococcus urinaeequi TaxID=51665 RepID=A0A7M1KW13_9LACT|nr:mannose-6-phosphate isomerase, class I [Aerococcus urinaeequi]AMB97596.1 mannose-6-phosphate isomerase [Aerococcus urinaeequi]QOQ79209.1 mannose-6-phosphate isomerase, class I [Aerococcus urinaeequi]
MQEPIFLKAYLEEKIWGGQKLRSQFNLDIPSDQTGEAWVISGHEHGQSIVTSPESLAGLSLSDLYQKHPEIFLGEVAERFPLLIKIIDAKEDLSVQVHPDDAYGLAHENDLGKTECWYIMDADPGAYLIYGHNAQNKEQFLEMVEENEWDQLLRKVPVHAGDFFAVPAGTIHAIGGGVLILETQQSSNTTYRVYDYGRKDAQGNERDLHIQQSADVTMFPHQDTLADGRTTELPGGSIQEFWTNEYFSVAKWTVEDNLHINLSDKYQLCTVLDGQGQVTVGDKAWDVKAADAFILPSDLSEVTLTGQFSLMVAEEA